MIPMSKSNKHVWCAISDNGIQHKLQNDSVVICLCHFASSIWVATQLCWSLVHYLFTLILCMPYMEQKGLPLNGHTSNIELDILQYLSGKVNVKYISILLVSYWDNEGKHKKASLSVTSTKTNNFIVMDQRLVSCAIHL